ncbi:MAG TPA: SpoIIIAH-like family protein [Symbiobacteriaceae bacterium]|nr:SpoIIIAH-like family protein [Symbiobacteriaceae bacterium]
MIIVKRKGEILRLGLFLVLVGAMVYFVMTRADSYLTSAAPVQPQKPAAGGAVSGRIFDVTPVPDARDFFAEARLARDQNRSLHQQELSAMVDNLNVDAAVRKSAAEELRTELRYATLETRAEALVRGRSVDDVLVTLTENKALVQVWSKDTSKQHAVQVADAVATVTGLKLNMVNVKFAN